jgi:hypothetical protein
LAEKVLYAGKRGVAVESVREVADMPSAAYGADRAVDEGEGLNTSIKSLVKVTVLEVDSGQTSPDQGPVTMAGVAEGVEGRSELADSLIWLPSSRWQLPAVRASSASVT